MDAYSVGYLCGSALIPTVAGYFLGRFISRQGGDRQVALLQERAGTLEPGAKVPSVWLGVLPFAFAVIGALVGLGSGFVSLAKERKAEDTPEKRDAGFIKGCQKTCTESNDPQTCKTYCACSLDELKRARPTPESLNDLFTAATKKDPAAMRELQEATSRCVPAQTQ